MEEQHYSELRPRAEGELAEIETVAAEPSDEIDQAVVGDGAQEIDELKRMLQRMQADFVNYRRRVEGDREQQQSHANSRLMLKLFPVMDEFGLAIDHAAQSDADGPWLEGVRLIQRKLTALLESESVTRIEAEGVPFDPFEHEALSYQESASHPDGQVMTVVRDGYKMHGRVIRPALVILAKNTSAAEAPTGALTEKELEDA